MVLICSVGRDDVEDGEIISPPPPITNRSSLRSSNCVLEEFRF